MQKIQQYENNSLNANSTKLVDLQTGEFLEELDDSELSMISGGGKSSINITCTLGGGKPTTTVTYTNPNSGLTITLNLKPL
jgi:hypothetical protein